MACYPLPDGSLNYLLDHTCSDTCPVDLFKDQVNYICQEECPSDLYMDEPLRRCVEICPELSFEN
jgi:hypothetical protein